VLFRSAGAGGTEKVLDVINGVLGKT
jgi:hypothetical protein